MIPDADHVVRYLRPTQVENGVVDAGGFYRADENEPSVNWLEAFAAPLANQLSNVRRVARITYAATGHLVQLQVGETREYVRRNDPNATEIQFKKDALPAFGRFLDDPSHALIAGMPDHKTPEAALIRDLLAKCVTQIHPARPRE
jgi:hypothetical protein